VLRGARAVDRRPERISTTQSHEHGGACFRWFNDRETIRTLSSLDRHQKLLFMTSNSPSILRRRGYEKKGARRNSFTAAYGLTYARGTVGSFWKRSGNGRRTVCSALPRPLFYPPMPTVATKSTILPKVRNCLLSEWHTVNKPQRFRHVSDCQEKQVSIGWHDIQSHT
jgi:hypothetical protein